MVIDALKQQAAVATVDGQADEDRKVTGRRGRTSSGAVRPEEYAALARRGEPSGRSASVRR